MGKFDLQSNEIVERFTGKIDIDDINWNVGLIVGKSGTGKTSIAKELFGDKVIAEYKYNHESVVDDMPAEKSMNEIIDSFNSVGFSSPHSWIKQYSVLSNGEKMRVDLARAILENKDLFVFDEFTSVVDRNIAQIGSYAIQKTIRNSNKKFIAVSCHHDIIDWLLPDWIFSTDDMTLNVSSKKKDQKFDSKFIEQKIRQSGQCLLNIII
jgi:ABC-type ATPase with predicted acetyltransferase domain